MQLVVHGKLQLQGCFLVIQDGADRIAAKVFRARAPPHGACENLVRALKLLAILHAGGDQLGGPDLPGSAEAEQVTSELKEVHRGGQSRGREDWRSGEEPERFFERICPRGSGRICFPIRRGGYATYLTCASKERRERTCTPSLWR